MEEYDPNVIKPRSTLHEYFIDAVHILRYLIGSDDRLETLIICNPHNQRFVTTDQEVYHALASINDNDKFKITKLSKFFESVSVRTVAKKQILTDAIVEKTRAEALEKKLN